MNEESRDYVQSLAKKLEKKYGSETVEIFYEYFSKWIELGYPTELAGDIAYKDTEKDIKEDKTLTAMG